MAMRMTSKTNAQDVNHDPWPLGLLEWDAAPRGVVGGRAVLAHQGMAVGDPCVVKCTRETDGRPLLAREAEGRGPQRAPAER